MPSSRPSQRTNLALLVVTALLPLCVAGAAVLAPPASGPVAAVFPPWWSDTRAFAAAGQAGPVVRVGGFGFVIIVAARERTLLRAAGAWLLLDPRAVGGCFPAKGTL